MIDGSEQDRLYVDFVDGLSEKLDVVTCRALSMLLACVAFLILALTILVFSAESEWLSGVSFGMATASWVICMMHDFGIPLRRLALRVLGQFRG